MGGSMLLRLALVGLRYISVVSGSALSHQSVPLNISSLFNNQGFGAHEGEASFDTLNQSYPAVIAGDGQFYTSATTGIQYYSPGYKGPETNGNIICAGQIIPVPPGPYFAVSLLHASDLRKKTLLGNLTATFSDNTSSTVELRSEPWWAFLAINRGDLCVHGERLDVTITGSRVKTVKSGQIKRLCPGDQKQVQRPILGNGTCDLSVELRQRSRSVTVREFVDVEIGMSAWDVSDENLARHESPDWFDDAKFGIFIHWGPYSVPGWGNSTPYESYADWFWWYSTHHPLSDKSDFYNYRLATFDPDWNYDDSFQNFTASTYDPKAWVDLIASSGAKYFVLTTKHHDGFSLFNTQGTTNRSSIHHGPHRDLLGELFTAAAKHQPQLKRGTYFSLPKRFNPDYGKYGFAQYDRPDSTTHPGIIARNPYANLTEPYTGHTPVTDFLTDVMLPQLNILAYNYSTDILWCDAGAANVTSVFAASWFNHARAENRDVTINSRCGTALVNHFETPECATFATPQRMKWESNRGMDPFSYGYNRATPDSEYMNATTLIRMLIDIVSKNGNLLLNIGLRADGSIPAVEVENLSEAGRWLEGNEEAVFGTRYWFWGR
ncbi:glycoside hydrolase superfamily [Clohesyomyces aquaticus]|uniref:alpha-L-fucosidase n=1 Tax=Clohesyomyces aquaticus TaxID=1231657 RepID=A0A1Y1YF63_9PLEO|nr:glycoside hydrolase superfamily [Clohesyomyces aquaticus]